MFTGAYLLNILPGVDSLEELYGFFSSLVFFYFVIQNKGNLGDLLDPVT